MCILALALFPDVRTAIRINAFRWTTYGGVRVGNGISWKSGFECRQQSMGHATISISIFCFAKLFIIIQHAMHFLLGMSDTFDCLKRKQRPRIAIVYNVLPIRDGVTSQKSSCGIWRMKQCFTGPDDGEILRGFYRIGEKKMVQVIDDNFGLVQRKHSRVVGNTTLPVQILQPLEQHFWASFYTFCKVKGYKLDSTKRKWFLWPNKVLERYCPI